jgi:hypothetical protein
MQSLCDDERCLPVRGSDGPLISEQSAGSGTREQDGIFATDGTVWGIPPVRMGTIHTETHGDPWNGPTYTKEDDINYDNENAHDDDDDDDDDMERVQRGRERNREHARRTRLRKKAQLQDLQQKYRAMMVERQTLNQQLQDRRIASILLGLSSSPSVPPNCICISNSTTTEKESDSSSIATTLVEMTEKSFDSDDVDRMDSIASSSTTFQIATPRRKRGFPEVEHPMNNTTSTFTIKINGVPTAISTKSHINWKNGTYCDETGRQNQMTAEQLESLRYVVVVGLCCTNQTRPCSLIPFRFFSFPYSVVNVIACMPK